MQQTTMSPKNSLSPITTPPSTGNPKSPKTKDTIPSHHLFSASSKNTSSANTPKETSLESVHPVGVSLSKEAEDLKKIFIRDIKDTKKISDISAALLGTTRDARLTHIRPAVLYYVVIIRILLRNKNSQAYKDTLIKEFSKKISIFLGVLADTKKLNIFITKYLSYVVHKSYKVMSDKELFDFFSSHYVLKSVINVLPENRGFKTLMDNLHEQIKNYFPDKSHIDNYSAIFEDFRKDLDDFNKKAQNESYKENIIKCSEFLSILTIILSIRQNNVMREIKDEIKNITSSIDTSSLDTRILLNNIGNVVTIILAAAYFSYLYIRITSENKKTSGIYYKMNNRSLLGLMLERILQDFKVEKCLHEFDKVFHSLIKSFEQSQQSLSTDPLEIQSHNETNEHSFIKPENKEEKEALFQENKEEKERNQEPKQEILKTLSKRQKKSKASSPVENKQDLLIKNLIEEHLIIPAHPELGIFYPIFAWQKKYIFRVNTSRNEGIPKYSYIHPSVYKEIPAEEIELFKNSAQKMSKYSGRTNGINLLTSSNLRFKIPKTETLQLCDYELKINPTNRLYGFLFENIYYFIRYGKALH